MKGFGIFRILLCILLWTPLCISAALSKDFNFHFQYLTNEQGLPQNNVNAIWRDSEGFMWFGTGNGLSRFDGYNFVNFSKPHLPSNLIQAIAETPDHRIWIGTSQGLCYFDMKLGTIVNGNWLMTENKTIAVLSLFADKAGNLWVGTSDNGVYLLEPNTDDYKITSFNNSNSKLPGNLVNCFSMLSDGRLLIGTNHGMAVYDYPQRSVFQWNDAAIQNSYVLSIMQAIDGRVWVGTFNGIYVFQLNQRNGQWLLPNPFASDALSHGKVNKIVQDSQGTIYVGTLGGLDIYQPATQSFYHVPFQGPQDFALNSQFVRTIYIDICGSVWIGTDKGGVNHFSLFQKPFYYLGRREDDANSLSNNTVNSIFVDNSSWWIGTAGGGLNQYNPLTHQYKHYRWNPSDNQSLSSDYITSLTQDKKQQLWVGTWGGGLCKMLSNGTFKRFVPPVNNAETNYQNAFISSLLPVDNGLMLVGTEGGLAVMDLATETFLKLDASSSGIAQIKEVGCLLRDRNNFIWVGTRLGLFRFSMNAINAPYNVMSPQNQIQTFKSSIVKGENAGLPGDYVISLYEDEAGNIWAGTYGDGVARIQMKAGGECSYTTYNQDNGLCNNVVYTIQQDDKGFMWFSTDKGLSRLNTVEGKFSNYFAADGLLSDQFYWSSSFKTKSGQLFFGGVNGLNYFYPSAFPAYTFEPNVALTGLKVFNKPVAIGEERNGKVVFNQSYSQTKELSLSYLDNVFSLEFSALDYFHPEKIKYAYQLEGVDNDWVEVSSVQRFATYTNLNGGTYQFKVKATNSDGVWSDHYTLITIDIRPPFYQTWWFRLFLVLFIVLLAVTYARYHSRRLIIQKLKLEKMVNERTRQIEEQSERLKEQANELQNANSILEHRQELIEGQKRELEIKNEEILQQRDQVLELNQQIELSNQTRLQFFTNVSHEFRTPLTLIISPIERLIKDMHLPGSVHDTLMIVQRNAQRLHLLIDQLLTFRKIETGNLKVALMKGDAARFVTDIFHAFDALAVQRSMDYNIDFQIDSSERCYDPEKLENVLYNLLSNAFKYTPEGGSISLKISGDEIKASSTKVPVLTIEVTDTGRGIPAIHLDKIFNPFYRIASHESIKGTGIGLALTSQLVEAMSGTIMVTSKEGKGSTFVVTLPAVFEGFKNAEMLQGINYDNAMLDEKVQVVQDQIHDEIPFLDEDDEEDEVDMPHILIVEDNRELSSFLAGALSDTYHVHVAENGKVGSELARKHSPDLIISDIMMPVMDGIEMCRQIKNNLYTSHIPVILLSARVQIENQLEGLNTGADDYIPKPFNLEILRLKVGNLIETRQRMRAMFSSQTETLPTDAVTSTLDEKFLAKAYEVLEAGYANSDFNVETFSDLMFVSRSLLYKKLKALIDLSPNDFITVFRLKKSLALLANKDLSVNEVAYRIGFNDPKYFSRVFKKFYKKTPSEYYN